MMIICKEDDSGYQGKDPESAFFIDETSMGDPWHDFGKWFGQRYCRGPGIAEQMAGMKDHSHIEFTKADFIASKEAIETMSYHELLDKQKLLAYLESRIGKHISTENW